ncbi:MAG: hypothetical protein U5L07_13295 [Desulfobacterales bacterium]|nr:hypothetical protein [Desulfobacterales bacterium]
MEQHEADQEKAEEKAKEAVEEEKKRLRKNPEKAGEADNIKHAGCMIRIGPIIGFRVSFSLKSTNT